MGPFWLPTINTALLLTSGVTLTIAHHALQAGQRAKTIGFMWITVLLGIVFLGVQGYEYYHAYTDLNLKLSSGIFGSTFFMLTGFHGFHVFVGMLMLLFITLRLQKGHFSAKRHFGFEGAAWYWHFVDVVWLGLVHPGLLDVMHRGAPASPLAQEKSASGRFFLGMRAEHPFRAEQGQAGGLDPAHPVADEHHHKQQDRKPTRNARARAMPLLRQVCGVGRLAACWPPRIMNTSAAPRLPTMATKPAITRYFMA